MRKSWLAWELAEAFWPGPLTLILDGGRCPVGIESTILDLTPAESLPPRLLRLGRVTPEQIATVIGIMPQIVTRPPDAATPRVPGSLAAHYAPTTPLHLLPSARIVEVIDLLQSTGRRCAVLCHSRLPATPAAHAWRCLPANPRAYASALYAALRELDQADAELIIVEEIPATPAWAAVADRLQRAAAGAGLSTAADTLG